MKKWKNAGLLFLAATVTCCSTVYAASDYIIADSNSRYLTYEDVGSLSLQQVNYAKNEIFARRTDFEPRGSNALLIKIRMQVFFDGIPARNPFSHRLVKKQAVLGKNIHRRPSGFLPAVE